MFYLDLASYSIHLPCRKGLERVVGKRKGYDFLAGMQARREVEDAHLCPSMSVGPQRSSLISYGTAWDPRTAPCSSEATVSINPGDQEQSCAEGRKRPLPGAWLGVRAHQVRTHLSTCHTHMVSHCPDRPHCPVKSRPLHILLVLQVRAKTSAEATFHVPHNSVGEAGKQEEEEYESALLDNPVASFANSAMAGASGIISSDPMQRQLQSMPLFMLVAEACETKACIAHPDCLQQVFLICTDETAGQSAASLQRPCKVFQMRRCEGQQCHRCWPADCDPSAKAALVAVTFLLAKPMHGAPMTCPA